MRHFLDACWSRLPFAARLMAATSFALLVAGALMFFVSARQEARDARASLAIELAQELETLPAVLAEVVVIGDFASLQQHLDRFALRQHVTSVKFADISGQSLHSTDKPQTLIAPDWFFKRLEFQDLTGTASVIVGSRNYGAITLTLGGQDMANHVWQRLRDQLAAVLLVAGLTFLGIWLVLRNGLAPLKRLESGAKAIANGSLETRLTMEGSPELRHLITAFNSMAAATQDAQARLYTANAELQRFAEVTAHHLQEPARRLASYAERLSTQLAGSITDAETQLSLDFIGQQARRMKLLLGAVERYLVADQARGKLEQTDVGQAVAKVLKHMQGPINASGCTLTIGVLPPAWIDAPRLADLFGGVLDNALQFAAADSHQAPLHITIDGERLGAFARYRVSDNGPGISEEYRERVFRVFERLSSRGEGTGIGLAIVRRIAQSCGGRAWIEESPGGGCRVLFELPAEKIS